MSATEAQKRWNGGKKVTKAHQRVQRQRSQRKAAVENRHPEKYADRIMYGISPEDY